MGGTQLQKSYKNYRLNKYIIEVNLAKDVNLLYNALTGAIIKLADFELSDIYTTKDRFYRNYMIETYYFVPDNFNEDNVIKQYRKKVKAPINENYLDKVGGFTILTTTACNAADSMIAEVVKQADRYAHMAVSGKSDSERKNEDTEFADIDDAKAYLESIGLA